MERAQDEATSLMERKQDEATTVRVAHLQQNFPRLRIMPSTRYTRSLFVTLRNKESTRSEFIFAADNLLRFLCEEAVAHIPYDHKVPLQSLFLSLTRKDAHTLAQLVFRSCSVSPCPHSFFSHTIFLYFVIRRCSLPAKGFSKVYPAWCPLVEFPFFARASAWNPL